MAFKHFEMKMDFGEEEQRKFKEIGIKDNPNQYPIIDKYNKRLINTHKLEVYLIIIKALANKMEV